MINIALAQKFKMNSDKIKTQKVKKQLQQMSHEDDIENQARAVENQDWDEGSTLNSTLDRSTFSQKWKQEKSKRVRSSRKKWDSEAYENASCSYLENDYLDTIDHISY